MYSCCPSVSHKVAHAESVPKSDARAGRLRFLVVHSANVILDSDTHLVEIHIECLLCPKQDCLSNMRERVHSFSVASTAAVGCTCPM